MSFARAILLLSAGVLSSCGATLSARCRHGGNYLVVDTSARDLSLCTGRTVVERFGVSLGRGGVGHHAHGANRTPVGTFTLAEPRPSQRFGTFISFLGAWGLHGPARGFRWAGRLNHLVDWTQGCIAIDSDAEIERIAAWIRREKARRIFIGPDGEPPHRPSASAPKPPTPSP